MLGEVQTSYFHFVGHPVAWRFCCRQEKVMLKKVMKREHQLVGVTEEQKHGQRPQLDPKSN